MSEVAVARAQTADEDFADFVAARGSTLWRSAWLLTGDPQRAEDLVQTALAKAWPHFRRVSSGGSFEAYVRRVMFTSYAAWWRRRWRGEIPSGDLPDEAALADASEATAVRRDVVTALAALPRGQRAVVVLRFYEDLTEAETAKVLGCSVGTVKSQTSRALAALRRSPALASQTEEAR